MKDSLSRADIVIGTRLFWEHLLHHALHPIVPFINGAGMSKDSDLLPRSHTPFPKAFGLLGDPKQLGPTILSTKEDNSDRSRCHCCPE